MRVISNLDNQQRIQDSFDRITKYSSHSLRELIQNMPLIVADDSTAQDIYNDHLNIFRRAYQAGFGAIKGSIEYQNEKYHLIVLNFTLIDRCGLKKGRGLSWNNTGSKII
jgi:hypothetical protein